jgi:hypothetical protein
LDAQPLDELPVLLRVLAFDHHDHVVHMAEVLPEVLVIAVIAPLRAHQAAALGVETEAELGVRHTQMNKSAPAARKTSADTG